MLRFLLLAGVVGSLGDFVGTYSSPTGSCAPSSTCCCPVSPVVVTQKSSMAVDVAGSVDGGKGCMSQTSLLGTFNIQNASTAVYNQQLGSTTMSITLTMNNADQLTITNSLGFCPVVLVRSAAIAGPPSRLSNSPVGVSSPSSASPSSQSQFPFMPAQQAAQSTSLPQNFMPHSISGPFAASQTSQGAFGHPFMNAPFSHPSVAMNPQLSQLQQQQQQQQQQQLQQWQQLQQQQLQQAHLSTGNGQYQQPMQFAFAPNANPYANAIYPFSFTNNPYSAQTGFIAQNGNPTIG